MAPAKPKAPKRNKAAGKQEPTIKEVASSITKAHVDGNLLPFDDTMAKGKQLIADGLQLITALPAMQNLTDVQIRDTFDYVSSLEDAVDETRKLTRQRVLDLAIRTGEATGTNGASLKLTFPDGKTLLAKAQKTGTDPKKYEANLRAKGADVMKYMVQTISYKMKDDGGTQAIDDGVFTQAEVDAMAYDISYAVERSKEGK